MVLRYGPNLLKNRGNGEDFDDNIKTFTAFNREGETVKPGTFPVTFKGKPA